MPNEEIDRLEISVEAEANKANRALSGMEKRLDKIANSLEKVILLANGKFSVDDILSGVSSSSEKKAIALGNKMGEGLVKGFNISRAGEQVTNEVKRLSENIAKNLYKKRLTSDFQSDMEKLSSVIKRNGSVANKVDDDYQRLYNTIKSISKIKISKDTARSLGDSYTQRKGILKSKFSTKEGTELDTIYQELSDQFKGILPSASSVGNVEDQFEALNNAISKYYKMKDEAFSRPSEFDDYVYESVIEDVTNLWNETKKLKEENDKFNNSLKETKSLSDSFDFDFSGFEKAQKSLDSLFKRRTTPREKRSDIKYNYSSLDDIFEKFKKASSGIDLSKLSLTELDNGLKKAEKDADKLNDKLNKKIATEGTDNLGKSWVSLVYDIQKATNEVEAYQEALKKANKENLSSINDAIQRGKDQRDLYETSGVSGEKYVRDIPTDNKVDQASFKDLNEEVVKYIYIKDEIKKGLSSFANSMLKNFKLDDSGSIPAVGNLKSGIKKNLMKFSSSILNAFKLEDGELKGLKNIQNMVDFGESAKKSKTKIGWSSDSGVQSVPIYSQIDALEKRIKSVKKELKSLAKSGLGFGDDEFDSAYASLVGFEKELKKLNKIQKETGANFSKTFGNKLSKTFNKASGTIKKLTKSISKMGKQSNKGMSFGRMIGSSIAFSFIFQGISAIQNALKEGSDNLVQYSDEYNQSISGIVSSLLYLKNAWAAAFAPIVNVVAPYISAFIDMIANAMNTVGQFFSALTGKGMAVQAKKVFKDYGASLKDTSDNAKDAADSVKDLENYTLGIDELNVIQPSDSGKGSGNGDGGSGAGEISPSDMFETVKVENAISDFAKRLRDAAKAGNWAEVGEIIAEGINAGMQKVYDAINWDNVGPKVTAFATAFTTAFNSMVSNIDWDLAGRTVGAGINTVVNTLNLFVTGIDWKNIGNSFATGINGMLYEVNWTNLGNLLGSYFMISWDIFSGFVKNLDYKKLGQSIADGINGILQTLDLGEITGSLSDFALGILDALNIAIDETDWEGVGQEISDALTSIDWVGIGKGLFKDLTKLISGLLDAFGELPGPVQVAASAIGGFLLVFKGLSIINSILKFINGAGGLIGSLKNLAAVFGGPVGIAIAAVIAAGILLIANWDDVKKYAKIVGQWIGDRFEDAREAVNNAFNTVGDWFSDRYKDIQNVFKNVKKFFKDAFSAAYDGVKEAFSGISDFFKGIFNGALKVIKNAVNGIIDGVNFVADLLGAGKPLKKWEGIKLAKGTSGLQSNTLAVVNDQKGPTYKEMVIPPNGNAFIPNGRNVMLPLTKGTQVVPAYETKKFMEGLPHFKNGIGDFFGGLWEKASSFAGNVWDYVSNPKKILQIALDKFVDITDLFEPWLSIAGGAVKTLFGNALDFIKKLFDKATPEVDYTPSAGVEQWRQLAKKALEMTGQYNESNLNRLLMQMKTESGGNPNAINNWDINAKRGTPSKGLMQVIDPTFKAYAFPGYNKNIYDPLSNMLAAIRYTLSRYGSLSNGWKGHGYATGGFPRMGEMFLARESGPELVGRIGNKNAVVNNNQIVESVRGGVESAFDSGVAMILNKMEEILDYSKEIARKDNSVSIDGKKADTNISAARKRKGYSFS